MATTDIMRDAQRPLAEYAYDLKMKYGLTYGQTREQFMLMYEAQEIQLSSVYENLFVAARTAIGKPVTRESREGYDFSNLGDMKIGVLQKDDTKNEARRFVISGVANKLGTIYFVGWNWITNEVCFFAIPFTCYYSYKTVLRKRKVRSRNRQGWKWETYEEKVIDHTTETGHPRFGYKILVNPKTGERSGGYYNNHCAYNSFEEMAAQD